MRQAVSERLQQDQTYKEKNKRATRERLQQNHNYKLANYKRAKKRLLENDSAKEKHRQAMRQRLQHQSYKEKNRQATREKLQNDKVYKLANYKRAKNRLKRLSTDDNYKQYKRTQMYMSRHMETGFGGRQSVQRIKVTRKVLTSHQKSVSYTHLTLPTIYSV